MSTVDQIVQSLFFRRIHPRIRDTAVRKLRVRKKMRNNAVVVTEKIYFLIRLNEEKLIWTLEAVGTSSLPLTKHLLSYVSYSMTR